MTAPSNVRPGRSPLVARLRSLANHARTAAYFGVRARWVKRAGMVRIPWSVEIWSPHQDVSFGDRVQFGPHCLIHCDAEFGNDILVARNVAFVGRDDHRYDVVGKSMWDSPRGDNFKIHVEDDAWIGHGAIIVAGARIGRGSIVAAGSLVIRDVPPYTIVGGNPAKVIRPRFSEEELAAHRALLWANHE